MGSVLPCTLVYVYGCFATFKCRFNMLLLSPNAVVHCSCHCLSQALQHSYPSPPEVLTHNDPLPSRARQPLLPAPSPVWQRRDPFVRQALRPPVRRIKPDLPPLHLPLPVPCEEQPQSPMSPRASSRPMSPLERNRAIPAHPIRVTPLCVPHVPAPQPPTTPKPAPTVPQDPQVQSDLRTIMREVVYFPHTLDKAAIQDACLAWAGDWGGG